MQIENIQTFKQLATRMLELSLGLRPDVFQTLRHFTMHIDFFGKNVFALLFPCYFFPLRQKVNIVLLGAS